MSMFRIVGGDERSREIAEEALEARKEREEDLQAFFMRMRQVRLLAAGRWREVFPRDFDEGDPYPYPKVANFFRDTIEDAGRLFAEQLPSEIVDAASETEEKDAERREQVLHAYGNVSELYSTFERYGQDMTAAGFTALKVWPDFEAPISKRFPIFERVDPELILPEPRWDPQRPSDHVIVHYMRTVAALKREFPVEIGELMEKARAGSPGGALDLRDLPAARPAELEVVDWWASDHIARIAVLENRTGVFAIPLVTMENPTGICPVQLAPRLTWGWEPMGQVEDAIGPVRNLEQYFTLLLDHFVEMVYGPWLAWNVQRPKLGPGQINFALGPDGRLERIGGGQPSAHVWQVFRSLEDSLRTDMINLRSREGEVDLNKASAAFLARASGKLNSYVKSLHRSWATAKHRANEAGFAQDETWCNAEKKITGRARGRRFGITYTPKDAIDGDYANRVSFGTASGMDFATHQTFLMMLHGNGLLDDETFFELNPLTEDVGVAMARSHRQAIKRTILEGLRDVPMIARLAAYRESEKGENFDRLVETLYGLGQPEERERPGELTPGPQEAPTVPPTRPGIAEAEAPALPPVSEIVRRARRR